MNKLTQKRKRVIYTLLVVSIGNSLVIAAPWIEVAIIKKLLLTFTNVAMFIIVWDAYFDEQLARKSNFLILQDLFAVTCLSVITTFILSKGITKIAETFTATSGTWGLGIAGAIAGIITAIIGIIWASYCDDLYRNSIS